MLAQISQHHGGRDRPAIAKLSGRHRFLIMGIWVASDGFGLAWLRDLLDHRLKSVEEIASVLQLPVLGALPYFSDQPEKGAAGRLVMLAPRSAAAESFRTLRTALHFGLAGRDDVKAIVVTSPSPGDENPRLPVIWRSRWPRLISAFY